MSLIVSSTNGQVKNANAWYDQVQDKSNLYEIQNAFYKTHKEYKEHPKEGEDENEGTQIYERYFQFMAPRVYPSGKNFNPGKLNEEVSKYLNLKRNGNFLYKNGDITPANWTYAGAKTLPGGDAGFGRTNFLKFHPTNHSIMYLGSPGGGLWKSLDGGNTFTVLADSLPVLGCTDLIINPRNPDSMVLATGDGYGYPLAAGTFWGGTYSVGVMYSNDGGKTWNASNLNPSVSDAFQIYRLGMNPQNPKTLVASANSGIYQSYDFGVTWNKIYSATKAKDIKYNPLDSNYIYVGSDKVLVSSDAGKTFNSTDISEGININAMALATCKAYPDYVYACYSGGSTSASGGSANSRLYISRNKGKTWSKLNDGQIQLSLWYYMPLTISQSDTNTIYSGSINIFKSTNGGYTFNQLTASYSFGGIVAVHSDHRNVIIHPDSAGVIYSTSDGGLHKSSDGGASWSYIASNVNLMMIYRLSGAQSKPDVYYTGLQDNGVNSSKTGNWNHDLGGDGMSVMVDWNNSRVAYATTQYGSMYRTKYNGSNWDYNVNPSTGNWTTPIAMSYLDPKVIYFGGNSLFKSVNGGSNWSSKINGNMSSSINIHKISLSAKTDSTIYIVRAYDQYNSGPIIQHTNNMGVKWTYIQRGLPTDVTYISDLKCDKYHSDTVYVTCTGFVAGKKVYRSTDAGKTWTNISGSLPNIPCNTVCLEYSDKHGIYVGTDAGIFYRNDDMSDWVQFQTGMPRVIVTDMEIYPLTGILRAATFGRGIWETSTAITAINDDKSLELKYNVSIYPNPSNNGIFNLILPNQSIGKYQITIFDLKGSQLKQINLPTNTVQSNLDLSEFKDGNYILNINIGSVSTSKQILIRK